MFLFWSIFSMTEKIKLNFFDKLYYNIYKILARILEDSLNPAALIKL